MNAPGALLNKLVSITSNFNSKYEGVLSEIQETKFCVKHTVVLLREGTFKPAMKGYTVWFPNSIVKNIELVTL